MPTPNKTTLGLLLTATLSLLLLCNLASERHHRKRLEENLAALSHQLSQADSLASAHLSIMRMRLTRGELRESRPELVRHSKALGLRLRRVKTLSTTHLSTLLDTLALLPDSLPLHHASLADSLPKLHYRLDDGWVSAQLTLSNKGAHWQISSHDTLRQVVHRVPHQWWIFRWGTRAIRQEITSSNPHTKIVYSEYIELER